MIHISFGLRRAIADSPAIIKLLTHGSLICYKIFYWVSGGAHAGYGEERSHGGRGVGS